MDNPYEISNINQKKIKIIYKFLVKIIKLKKLKKIKKFNKIDSKSIFRKY